MSHITITTRIKEPAAIAALDEMGREWGVLERRLFVEKHAQGALEKDAVNTLKRSWLKQHGMTSSQFNALDAQLRGKLLALKEGVSQAKASLGVKIKRVEKELVGKMKPNEAHQKRRRLFNLKARLASLEARKPTSLCFGSRRLFREQFALKANGHHSHADWQAAWREERSSHIMCLGTGAERAGNASCTMMEWDGETGTGLLRLRRLGGKQPVTFPVTFSYLNSHLDNALKTGLPITYRFHKKHGTWYVHASMARVEVALRTFPENGYFGVDLNVGHVSCARIAPDGNLLSAYDLDFRCKRGESQPQKKAKIQRVVSCMVEHALAAGTPIVIEKLDFAQKKKELRTRGQNRMLSAFAYATFSALLHSRAQKFGVEVLSVNPAYSSQIGFWKFGKGMGLPIHQSATFCIARRGGTSFERVGKRVIAHSKFSERLVVYPARNTPVLPARNRTGHVWQAWGKLPSPGRSARLGNAGSGRGRKGPVVARDDSQSPDWEDASHLLDSLVPANGSANSQRTQVGTVVGPAHRDSSCECAANFAGEIPAYSAQKVP